METVSMDDLIKRLREPDRYGQTYDDKCEAANEIEQLREEEETSDNVRKRQSDLLRGVANALHGGPLEDGWWSHHDLPELARTLVAENERLRAALGDLYGLVRKQGIDCDLRSRIESLLPSYADVGEGKL
jgi:hypothetical protein